MKLKRVLSDIKEDYFASVRSVMGDDVRELFVNPDRSELRDLIEETGDIYVRFIADKRKEKVYLSSSDVVHVDIAMSVGYSYNELHESDYLFAGTGIYKEGYVEVNYFGDTQKGERTIKRLSKEILEGNFDWMEKYPFKMDKMEEIARDFVDEV